MAVDGLTIGGLSTPAGEDDVWKAARMGRRTVLDGLVAKDPELVTARDKDEGGTALHWAARGGGTTMIMHLLKMHGAPLEAPDAAGMRPLHWAARGGNAGAMHALVEAGAELEARDGEGRTPLFVACACTRLEAAMYLVGRGADVGGRDRRGWTPLHAAADKGHGYLVSFLVYFGRADVEAVCEELGRTALHVAAEGSRRGGVERLVIHGASASARDRQGKTPGQLVAEAKDVRGKTLVQSFLEAALKQSTDGGAALKKLLPGGNHDDYEARKMWRIYMGNVAVGCIGYGFLIFPGVPDKIMLHMTLIIFLVAMLICLRGTRGDPGYLSMAPGGAPKRELDAAMRKFAATGEPGPLRNRLCHQCAVLQAPRTVHCEICGRCVARYDHHCPFVLNCIGERNRMWFICTVGFAFLASYCVVVGSAIYLMRWARVSLDTLVALLLLLDFTASAVYAANLGLYHVYLAATNQTSYDTYTSTNGKSDNPYDMGVLSNLLFFVGLGTQRGPKSAEDMV